MDFGGLTIVQDYLVWTLADMVLSNLKTGRDESSSRGSNPTCGY